MLYISEFTEVFGLFRPNNSLSPTPRAFFSLAWIWVRGILVQREKKGNGQLKEEGTINPTFSSFQLCFKELLRGRDMKRHIYIL